MAFPMTGLTIPQTPNAKVEPQSQAQTVQLTNLDKVVLSRGWLHEARPLAVLRRRVARCSYRTSPAAPMVLKRYPNGIHADYFYMKRTPSPHVRTGCAPAPSGTAGSVIDFPMIDDTAALLWAINLGCIDLNEWYSAAATRRPTRLPPLRPRSG